MTKSFRSKISHYPEEIPIHFLHHSEIIGAIKPYLNISRLFGVPGFSVIENVVSRGSIWTLFTLLALFLLANQVFLLGVRVAQGEDFVRKSGPEIILRVHVILVLIWSLVFSKKLATALRDAPLLEGRINKVYNSPDSEFIPPWVIRRKCIAWTILYILLALALGLKSLFIDVLVGSKSVGDWWTSLGSESCALSTTSGMFLHTSVSSGYCLVMEFVTAFLWLFPDFLLLQLSLILSEMFRRINTKGIERIEPSRLSSTEIDLVREHHGLVSKLVKEFDDAIAALILINVALTTAFVVLAIYSIVASGRRRGLRMADKVTKLYCKISVGILKLLLGLFAASVLHHRAHEAIAEVRSWPMTREFSDFSLNNGRPSVIQAFLSQLSHPSIGFTLGKLLTITAKLLAIIALGVGIFFAFARITISSCSRGRGV